MEESFGENSPSATGPLSPTGSDDYRGPVTFRFNPDESEPYTPEREPTFRYKDVSFFLLDGAIAGFMVTAAGATTERGVGIGDPLEEAETAYELTCGTALENSEYEPYAACTGRVGPGRYVWFGGDPIENITVGIRPLGGV